jgi:DnaK suppressor protein
MKSANLQQFKQNLETQKEESFRLLHRWGDESRTLDIAFPQDSGDQSVTSLSKESLFHQSSQRRGLVRKIEAALWRIDQGTFGVCTVCGHDIPIRRLEALPWTEHCLRCQEILEQEREFGHDLDMPSENLAWRQTG